MYRLTLFFIIFLFFPYSFKAHKPKVKIGTYGNVKTFFFSGFNFGDRTIESQELKIQVIGKLAESMLKKLNYTDPVLIEYKKRYDESSLFILENNNSNYKILGFESGILTKSNCKGFGVCIIDDNLDVVNVLRILEYCIVNRKSINNSLQPVHFKYSENGNMTVLANSEDFIKKITGSHSVLTKKIIAEETELLNHGFMNTRISWKNGVFIFGYNETTPTGGNYISFERTKYILKDFNYYIESSWADFFIIFNDSDHFTYFDGNKENTSSQKLAESVSTFYAFSLGKDRLADKVILINSFKNLLYIYHINKKLLQKIE
ncbi:hypothetical protein [uncultured Chryseobacterium sp.]|uniref:hypothetical protein n=1 Tax=uncultured Chryseobacterium sp. TaxID=259322 RepID=UPI0025DEA3F5|nr:hypothetical protein [uncultured Chryseobacterium sp.]